MKSPPTQYSDDEARRMVEEYITSCRQAGQENSSS
jgi:myo-inositol-1-phosphate synthase